MNLFHALFNLVALAPLLERFEAEHGTLVTLALFFGREWAVSQVWNGGALLMSGN